MKIAIYGQNYAKESSQEAFGILVKNLLTRGAECVVEFDFFQHQNKTMPGYSDLKTFTVLDSSFDLLISIGGDGTILRAITYVRDLAIPIVGVNTGRLGFLATIKTDEISAALEAIFNGDYKISERTLLAVTTSPDTQELAQTNFALNEIALSRKNTTSMITVNTHVNGEYLTSYWADGLIMATPTGSTGYSLSCGGPVITPNAGNFVLTPIAPHNLNARPLVIPDSSSLTFKVDGREDQFLMSLDSRIVTLSNTTIVKVKKADFVVKMVERIDESFLVTLRKKLLWGEDKRN